MDEELLELGPRRPALVRWLSILAIVLAVIGITTHAVRRSAVSPTPLAATPRTVGTVSATVPSTGVIALPGVSQRPFPMDTAAVVLGGVPQFAALERTDGTAAQGPWSLVVRRRDGSLGRHGAVITYPEPGPRGGIRFGSGGPSAQPSRVDSSGRWPAHTRESVAICRPQTWFASLWPRLL